VDERFATGADAVYAIGDAIRGPMLAHKAQEERTACVEAFAGGGACINHEAIPGVVYTSPEIASVGRTEDELQEAGIEYRKKTFPFLANGHARVLDERKAASRCSWTRRAIACSESTSSGPMPGT
jgi:dihydrolipoamide dehydrogenase